MTVVWGLTLGAGLLLVWLSLWPAPIAAPSVVSRWSERTADQLTVAGVTGLTPAGLAGMSAALGLLVALIVNAASSSLAVAIVFGALSVWAPGAIVAARARRTHERLRDVWPEVVDHLASGIRAGLSLPEAVSQLGTRGPAQVRPHFELFAQDFRASGRFGDCLDALKARLADPVADRIIEALRLTRDVGGKDIGTLLRTLSQFLREDARMRGELEARQSWIVNAARLAAAAPWLVLIMLSTRPENARSFDSPTGAAVLITGAVSTVVAYQLMMRIGRLPQDKRVLR